jgi:predicted dehydrogenase
MQKVDVAVVGVGHLGRHHAFTYKKIHNANLVAVCDINRDRLNEVSSLLGVRGYLSHKDLFSKVRAVSIAVPTALHYRIAREFLSHKIHVLIEKPITTSLKQADSLIKLSKKNKLILQVGHIERFNSAFTAIKGLIKEPRFIECHRLSHFPDRSLDIGVVLDLMIHDIDIVLGLVNSKVKKIDAVGVNVLTDLEDIANARIRFKNGCICNLTASRVSNELMRKIRIFLKNTYISLDYKNAEAFIYKKAGSSITRERIPIEKEEPLKKELSSFIECIANRRRPVVSGEVARDALSLALGIQKQIWQKRKF